MRLEFDQKEMNLLTDILKDHVGEIRDEVYHADTPAFKDELKETEKVLNGIIWKLECTSELSEEVA